MERVLSPSAPPAEYLTYCRALRRRWKLIAGIVAMAMLTTPLLRRAVPLNYTATVRLQLSHERLPIAAVDEWRQAGHDPALVAGQCGVIISEKILQPVGQRLDLARRWGGEKTPLSDQQVVSRLKTQLKAEVVPGTSMLSVTATDADGRLACDIANAVADVFQQDRAQAHAQQRQALFRRMVGIADQQAQRMRDAQREVHRLANELGMATSEVSSPQDALADRLAQQLTQARLDSVGHQMRLTALRELTAQDMHYATTPLVSDPVIGQLLQQLNQVQTTLPRLRKIYRPTHPRVEEANQAIRTHQEQLRHRLDDLIRGLEVESEVAAARVSELKTQWDVAQQARQPAGGERLLALSHARRDEQIESRLYEALRDRAQRVAVDADLPHRPVEVIEPAREAPRPVGVGTAQLAAALAVLGLTLAVAVALLWESLDRTVKRIEDIEQHLRVPVLGVVTKHVGLVHRGTVLPEHVQAYRMLRNSLEFARTHYPVRCLAVLGAAQGEGKSVTAANLACIYAQHGARVLLVDADLHRPLLHELFSVRSSPGLRNFLTDGAEPDELAVATAVPGVWVTPAGNSEHDAPPAFASDKLQEFNRRMQGRFDMIIYDTPPVLSVSDAAVIAREVVSTILVVQHRRHAIEMHRRAKQLIVSSGSDLMGVVLSGVDPLEAEQCSSYYDRGPRSRAAARAGERVGWPRKTRAA